MNNNKTFFTTIGINGNNALFLESTGFNPVAATSDIGAMSGHSSTQLIVFRILDRDNAENPSSLEQITAWINPNLSQAPDVWLNPLTVNYDLLRTVSNVNVFQSFAMQATVSNVGQVASFDEIQLASDWESIGVIPEPGTLLLLGFALGSLLLYRRRR